MMQKKSLKKLVLALGLGLGSLGMVPSAQSMSLATDGLGQVLIFPYYTVRGGWTTLFNITNTSDQILAIKIRFHESYNSRDVFDFNVIMSQNDVWNGWVALDPVSGGPAFHTKDNTCTTLDASAYAGLDLDVNGLPFQSTNYGTSGVDAYTNGDSGNNADGGPTTVARMNEGYIEAILMASSAVPPASGTGANPLIRGAVHVNSVPTGCTNLANAFYIWNNYLTLFNGATYGAALGTNTTAIGFTAPIDPRNAGTPLNPLKGSYNLVNGAKGWTAAGTPTTIADFTTASNLLTSMLPPGVPPGAVAFSQSFLEPSLNSGDNGAVGIVPPGNAPLPTTAVPGVGAVSDLLARTRVINQWTHILSTADSAWVTATNWVLNFPTKGFYVDNLVQSAYAARSAARDAAAGVALAGNIISVPAVVPVQVTPAEPFTSFFANDTGAVPQLNGRSCFPIGVSVYDREENPLANGVSPGGNNLCYETNVLTFGPSTTATNNILSSAEAKGLAALIGENGYLDMTLTPIGALVPQGLPVISFAVTSRDTGDGTLNEAFLIDAAYSRNVPPANP